MIERLLSGFEIDGRVRAAARAAEPRLLAFDRAARVPIRAKIIEAFLAEGIAESDLAAATGYGYDDPARERYESLLARIFAGERALARLSLVSGTHAIVTALAACVAPGQTLLSVTGRPYDTLHHAIVDAPHSLVHGGMHYEEVALDENGRIDPERIAKRCLEAAPAAVFVQRSRGYSARPSLDIDACAAVVTAVKEGAPGASIIVDNCYGELVEEREPLEVGADLAIGSLIKNLGGGIAPTGGYVVGRDALVERIAARLYAPGLGAALGPSLGFGRAFVQGLFYAPLVVDEALRGLDFAADLFARLGFAVDPLPGARRTDVIQAIRLGRPDLLVAFARGLQKALPINARFSPEPGHVPGYVDPVVMSSGAFISGATIELSCDAPMREPYDVYLQGGLMAEHVAIGAALAADAVLLG
ncbi:MAG TPA: methionine gamma-lyase family protein [Candidatus Binatia bacterium]|nr:methionine gamma-lyase family protein [Candidatus Binatia bacterium]